MLMLTAAAPSTMVTIAVPASTTIGLRATNAPTRSTTGPAPGIASETGLGALSVRLASRRPSRIARAAGTRVSITRRPKNTPNAATSPKSRVAGMGETTLVEKAMIVVPAARPSGSITARRPPRAASTTLLPAIRCSR